MDLPNTEALTGRDLNRNKDFSNIFNVSMSHPQINASEDTENLTFEGIESLNSNSIHNITKMRKKFLKAFTLSTKHLYRAICSFGQC